MGAPLFLALTNHPGKLVESDIVDNLMRLMVMDETEERERLSAEEAKEEIEKMDKAQYRALRAAAERYLDNEPEFQIYRENNRLYQGLELRPIEEVLRDEEEPSLTEQEVEERLQEALDEFSLSEMEMYLLESAVRE